MSRSEHVSILHDTKQGKTCNLVAHGYTMRQEKLPKFKGEETICVNCWRVEPDYLIFMDRLFLNVILRGGFSFPKKTKIITSRQCEEIGDYVFEVKEYPPVGAKAGGLKTGVKGLYLAVNMGYDKIYLYGYDFLPVSEDKHQGEAHFKKHLAQFERIDWPKDRIIQTNPESRLQFCDECGQVKGRIIGPYCMACGRINND